ncbi:hypothetical protein ACE38W_14395 [Chitinophaga sp. Hz27]|uniref:hypothetical protein n=1 Tax=Chitinophaga sp. Hz27 TaxID=3347169 RepID=UPI0035E0CF15
MKRPVTVPESANYDPANKAWLYGETNENNQRIGLWKKWHEDGHHWATIDYREGIPPYPSQYFHPDGTIAMAGDWYGGDKYLGPLRFIKSDHPTPEYFPTGNAANVWIAEFDYVDEFIYIAQRYFDKDNTAISSDGDPLPARPDNVPSNAHFIRSRYSATNWVMGTVDTRIANYIGEYSEWDLNGKPVVQRVYSNTSEVLEEQKYDSGALSTSCVYDKNDRANYENNFYYSGMDTPTLKIRRVHCNAGKKVTNTYYDKGGQQLYSVCREEISPLHKRRYFNEQLVCEGHITDEADRLPESAIYYTAEGATLIDFTNNNDGTGYWRLYNAAGQMLKQLVVNENGDDHLHLTRWDTFLPTWASYTVKTKHTDSETAVALFNRYYDEIIASSKLQAMEVPPYLQKELDAIDWETIDTYHSGGSAELPIGINGMLSEDDAVAKIATIGSGQR